MAVHVEAINTKQVVPTFASVDVVLLRWPSEAERREELQLRQVPRLLLVRSDQPPPALVDCFEDWVRLPATDDEIDVRARAVLARTTAHIDPRPVLDGDGVLRCGKDWVALPPLEARLTAVLLDRFGAVVSRDRLSRAAWSGEAPSRNALDVHVLRLRRRLVAVSLVVTTVRCRGYLLERSRADGQR
jgi:two-component system OmpR family response regulator